MPLNRCHSLLCACLKIEKMVTVRKEDEDDGGVFFFSFQLQAYIVFYNKCRQFVVFNSFSFFYDPTEPKLDEGAK